MNFKDSLPIVGGVVGLVGGICGAISAYLNWDRNRIAREAHALAVKAQALAVSAQSIQVEYSVALKTADGNIDALCLTVFNKSSGQTVAIKDWGLDNGFGPNSVNREPPASIPIEPKRSRDLQYLVSCYVNNSFHFGSRTSLWVQFEHEADKVEVPLTEKDEKTVRTFAVWVQAQRACKVKSV